ncbi:carbon-nitrogen hydrolase family protein [Dasania sp. GY-MA-18]|uniref:Carbon-nitrogen hydrolase family protein n=1 Tax=Dasania phycosphaerae TaxID=2950436 RepID=A0A9J6RKB9_9GAMM|nr:MULTISPECIES: carbon-nitrogen hydrolase family protein [Dasania]MCR8922244.1 carbon-nitrogen hydrolase family protein [Dasania sp. GY-MA-18]MCZ0864672.1 carbon-nitrogen hydrolase family protein [Dasania phycosphaerae]MCZ0868400.1 carbon-nitrogen hydrolase family protein [Dasania phycosphaerae]
MSHFSIAGLQLELSNQDNFHFIEQEIERVKRVFPWVDMVVLSELSTFGTSTKLAQPMPGPAEQRYCDIAVKNKLWIITGSLFEQAGEHVYNTSSVINPQGEVVTRYRKLFPFYPYEKGVTPGEHCVVFDVPEVGRFGISICYDQWFPEISRSLACMGAEVILCPTLTGTIDRELELAIARTNAVVSQSYFFNINVAGRLGNGRSIVVGPDGQVIHQAGEKNEIIPIEVDLNHVRRVRERGVLGLGQTLKSFRDSQMQFPAYQPQAKQAGALAALGPLKKPGE